MKVIRAARLLGVCGVLLTAAKSPASGSGLTDSRSNPVGDVDFVLSSPPNPVGAGARAVGVGSAFIALADDATAASWNPAGLSQLERPELSIVGRFGLNVDEIGHLSGSSSGGAPRSINGGTDTATSLDVNYLSAAVPFSWRGRNVVASLNYQQLFSFARDWTYVNLETSDEVRFRQYGGLYAVSPASSIEVVPGLSIGGALNILVDGFTQSFAWRSRFVRRTKDAEGEPFIASDHPTFGNFDGVNATFGLLSQPVDTWSLGAVVKLPFQSHFTFTNRLDAPGATGSRRERLAMEFPLSFGAGVAWHPTDESVISCDFTRVEWDQFRVTDAAGHEFLVSGELADEADVAATTSVRLGGEYLVPAGSERWAFRAGAFYDPEPASGKAQDFWGVATGIGISSARLSIDLAYQLRFGLDVAEVTTVTAVLDMPSAEVDIFQHSIYLSAIYYF